MTFVDKDGEEKLIKVPIGMSMLEAAHENDIELEGEWDVIARKCTIILFSSAVLSLIILLVFNPFSSYNFCLFV